LNIAFYSLLGIILLQPKLNTRSVIFITIGVLLLLHILVLWTAVKGEYRSYISKGQTSQAVLVSRTEANAKLYELITDVGEEQYKNAIEIFVDRLGYIQYFGASLDYVPKVVPYQNGQIYLGAVQHYLVPRFLNPNKAVLDDSKHTSEFTGISFSGSVDATSFSLGYIADAYIDFGPIFMFPLLFVFGALFGFFFKYLAKRTPNEFWSWILTSAFLLLLNINGTDTKKALGWVLIYFLVVAILRKRIIRLTDRLMRA